MHSWSIAADTRNESYKEGHFWERSLLSAALNFKGLEKINEKGQQWDQTTNWAAFNHLTEFAVVWKFPPQNGLICSQAQLSQLTANKAHPEPKWTWAFSEYTLASRSAPWWSYIIKSYQLLIYYQKIWVSCFTRNIMQSPQFASLLAPSIPLSKGQITFLS